MRVDAVAGKGNNHDGLAKIKAPAATQATGAFVALSFIIFQLAVMTSFFYIIKLMCLLPDLLNK